VVVVQPEVQAAPTPVQTIAPPEALPPEASSSVNTSAPTPEVSEPAPAALSSEAATPKSSVKPEVPTTDSTGSSGKSESALVQRRQVIQQRLAELVAKDKSLKEEQLRENLIASALQHARTGEFDQARKLAKDPILPADLQADLLSQIDALQAQAEKLSETTNTRKSKPGTQLANGKTQLGDRSARSDGSTVLMPVPVDDGTTTVYPTPFIYQGAPPPRITLPWRSGTINLAFPLTVNAPITSTFGWRVHPIHGVPRFHRGIDIGAPVGTPVIAAHAGTVETAGFLSGYGLTVILKYKNGTQATLYGHLSEVFVKPGDVIKQGDVIALVGNTGLSTGPHLHFEVQQLTTDGWVAMDPMGPLQQGLALVAGQPLPLNLSGTKLDTSFTPGIASGMGLTGTYATRELLMNSLFPGLLNLQLAEKMDILVPLAIANPIAPELGWIAYPWMRELTPWQLYGTQPQPSTQHSSVMADPIL
jgi:murein DD-endopeptidase MepM/ murein hydrolase activator NlpD